MFVLVFVVFVLLLFWGFGCFLVCFLFWFFGWVFCCCVVLGVILHPCCFVWGFSFRFLWGCDGYVVLLFSCFCVNSFLWTVMLLLVLELDLVIRAPPIKKTENRSGMLSPVTYMVMS